MRSVARRLPLKKISLSPVRGLALAAILVAGSSAFADTTAEWTGNTGNWTDPTQWSTNPNDPNNGTPSGVNYDADFSTPGTGPYTATLANNIAVDGVTINSANATLAQTGGTLTAPLLTVSSGAFDMTGGVLQNTLLTNAGGSVILQSGTLNNITLGSDVTIGPNVPGNTIPTVTVQNGLTAAGHTINIATHLDISLEGTAYTLSNATIDLLNFGSALSTDSSAGSAPLTFGASATIEGNGTVGSTGGLYNLINQGTILANTSDSEGAFLVVGGQTLSNMSTMKATNGGGLEIDRSALDNTDGTIESDSGSSVILQQVTCTTAKLGTLINNGSIDFSSSTIDNTGQTFSLGAGSGSWLFNGNAGNTTISNGIVSLPPANNLTIQGLFLKNVTLASDIATSNAVTYQLFDLDLAGNFNAAGHTIYVPGSLVFDLGTSNPLTNATVVLGGSTSSYAGGYLENTVQGGPNLTFDSTVKIQGWGDVGSDPYAVGAPNYTPLITNQGIIRANASGKTLIVNPTSLVNTGTLSAIDGATLAISPNSFTQNGTLWIDATSMMTVSQSLQFGSNSTLDEMLGSNGTCGILHVSGNLDLTLSPMLNLSIINGASFSTPFEIVSYTGTLSGIFAQVTPGFTINYGTPGEILVTAIPEPASIGLMLIGAGLLCTRRRNR